MVISVLITGGTGFLGSAIVEALKEKHPDWILTVMDLNLPRRPRPRVHYMTGSVVDAIKSDDIMKELKPTVIIHTVGIVPSLSSRYATRDRDHVFDVNVNGTRTMLRAAKKHGVRAFVWTGSSTCVTDDLKQQYPNIDEAWPTPRHSMIYGESKAAAEALVIAASDDSLATCALRPSVIFGPGDQQLIPSLHACIAKGETPFLLGDGDNLWDVTYVGNVADAHVLAAENLLSARRTAAGQAIFISNEEPVPFRAVCLEVWKRFGHHPPFQVRVPVRLAVWAGYVAELVTWGTGAPATLSRGSVRDACATRYCSGAKARTVLGYSPRVGIEEGIRVSCEEFSHRLEQGGEEPPMDPIQTPKLKRLL